MITIIGTAHISQESVEEVRKRIEDLKPDLVAVELCQARYKALVNEIDVPLFNVIRGRDSTLVLGNILLSFLQRRLGKETGVKPGKEMLTALETARNLEAGIALIDRNIDITMKRALSRMGIVEKLKILKEMFTTFTLSGEDIEDEIKELKKEETLEKVLENFKSISPNIYEIFVKERDAFMAHELLELSKDHENIVAVVGAGHKTGIEHYLKNPKEIPDIEALLKIPKKRFSITKTLRYAVPALIIGVFILAFYKGVPLDKPLGLWILYNAVPTFLAVLIVGGSIFSALVGMVASPLTSLNPLLAAGWFAGATEIKVKNVTVGDVGKMFKITGYKELFRNKAFKVLLVTVAANIGSSLGTFISIPKVILPLVRSIFG